MDRRKRACRECGCPETPTQPLSTKGYCSDCSAARLLLWMQLTRLLSQKPISQLQAFLSQLRTGAEGRPPGPAPSTLRLLRSKEDR